MNYSKYRFNLDMQSYISQVSLPVRQNDTGIVLRINLTDGGVPYTIKDGCMAVFFAKKSDGSTVINYCYVEKNTTICYELTQVTTCYPGIVDCEIRLYGTDGNIITTPRFILAVDSRVLKDDDIDLPVSEMTVLDNIIISETVRQDNEVEREKTHEQMLATTEEASQLAATLRQKLDTGDYDGEDGLTPYIGSNGNWWIGNEDTGILASGYTIPLRVGQAAHSIEQQDEAKSNKAITENSVALGEGSIAGAKGYYIREIFYGNTSTNPQIRITTEQPKDTGLYISSSALTPNPSFTKPNYANGDVFNLICNDHFALFGTITSITNDVITFTGDTNAFKSGLNAQISYGHAKMSGNYYVNLVPNYDDYTLCVPTKPLEGIVEVCKTAFASGCENVAAGEYGNATGKRNTIVGAYGHAEGSSNLAGYSAHAEGQDCEAPAKYSHAQNKKTKAKGYASHSQNVECEAEGEGATAEGYRTKAKMKYSHTEGNATETNADTVPLADGAHAEGRSTKATNYGAHAEGAWTVASGEYSHAQNYETTASGTRATSMGHRTTASGSRAVAEGEGTIASGYCSHAAGFFTKATSGSQFVVGDYNKENSNAYLIVGNGTSDTARSNAFEVLKNGYYTGRVLCGQYVGTGVLGADNPPNTLTFPVKPTILIILPSNDFGRAIHIVGDTSFNYYFMNGNNTAASTQNVTEVHNADGTFTISWYCNGFYQSNAPQYQLNNSDCTYAYIAYI